MLFFCLSLYLLIYIYVLNKIIFFSYLNLRQDKFGVFRKSSLLYNNIINFWYLHFFFFFNFFLYLYILFYNFFLHFDYVIIVLNIDVIFYFTLITFTLNSILFNFYRICVMRFYDFSYLIFYFILFTLVFLIFFYNNFCMVCLFLYLFFLEFLNIALCGFFIKNQQFKNAFYIKKFIKK